MMRSYKCSIPRKRVVQEDEIDRAREDPAAGVGRHTWSERHAKSMRLARRFKLPPLLLDGLLNNHVYTSGIMGSNQSKTNFLPKTIARRGNKRTGRFSDVRFRVLIIGRANAGKTSILQRVCDTTESPKIYRGGEEVRNINFIYKSDLTADQVKLDPSMEVRDTSIPLPLPLNAVSARRARHRR